MTFTPYTHIVSLPEVKSIEAIGFSIGGSSMVPEVFINAYFPNFDLLSAVRSINAILSPTTVNVLYKKVILEEGETPKIEIQFYSNDYDNADTGLVLVRTFSLSDDGLIVTHEFFRLPREARRKGISKKILLTFFQQYVNMGVKKILVHAALEDGGLVWAKQFFKATNMAEVNAILVNASKVLPQNQFLLAKRIHDDYYTKTPKGQSFPMIQWAELPFMEPILRNSSWHGAVDLTNPVEFSNFVSNAFG